MMTMKEINKDILTVNRGIIAHQVNARGIMGSGLALHIRDRWPGVYNDYREAFKKGQLKLGSVILCRVYVGRDLYVANLVGQDRFGTDRRYTNYAALEKSLWITRITADYLHLSVYIPYLMGCGLGGGDWDIIQDIITRQLPEATICRLRG
jgi:O-acetyl-ADP-ribose deacetylase (regulator of RNase III)